MSENEQQQVVCQHCQHRNPADMLKCEHCGTLLKSDTATTVHLTNLPGEIAAMAQPEHTDLLADGLSLYIAGEVRPLNIRGKDEIILGRHTGGEQLPTFIDLKPYNASMLGVSRQHAKIARHSNAYTIEDLGSTNGTWLNEEPLSAHSPFALRNGDQLRLGRMILFAYFAARPGTRIDVLKGLPSDSVSLDMPTHTPG
jgi:pSer/pThr/pTyr-binding forkhead associated (FHA) protein